MSQVDQPEKSSERQLEEQPQQPEDDAPREVGGRSGPDPTRYGDWEKNGRCIDF
ncbi:MAG: DUF1674 domain-containing protein [Gammaproteobacteria bacterium]|nr:DUF1674 domain-containing protein [Gammaproteobacteria bacterium]MDH3768087.1 DUF1674 domain-containing protein [Gammaproteobacteria bacterium]